LLFLRRVDELQNIEEIKAAQLKKPMERRIFPEGKNSKRRLYMQLRWSRFKNMEAREMFEGVSASGREGHCRWTMRGFWSGGYVEHYNGVRLN
jgi:hypothetical protein